jgi:hypothetical protein
MYVIDFYNDISKSGLCTTIMYICSTRNENPLIIFMFNQCDIISILLNSFGFKTHTKLYGTMMNLYVHNIILCFMKDTFFFFTKFNFVILLITCFT